MGFIFRVNKSFNKIRIGANGSARDTLAIFTMQGTLSENTHLGITITVTNVTQGSFEFGNVMIVDRVGSRYFPTIFNRWC